MPTRRSVLKAGAGLALASLVPSWLVEPARRRTIDLQSFCGSPSRRYDVAQPFVQGDWTYATDERVCVRVGPLAGDRREALRQLPPAAELAWDHDQLKGWRPWPGDRPILAEGWCPECDGTGFAGKGTTCEPCNGDGYDWIEIEWDSGQATLCRECGGRGQVGVECPACEGRARGIYPCLVRVGDSFFNVKYHRKVLALGGVEYAVGPQPGSPVRLRFGEGDALLMPVDSARAKQRIEAARTGGTRPESAKEKL